MQQGTLCAGWKINIPGDIRVTGSRWTTIKHIAELTAEGHRGVHSPRPLHVKVCVP